MKALTAHGLSVRVPRGWEAQIRRHAESVAGERTLPVLHAANFALPAARDDFGGGVTHLMRSSDAFVAVFEYGPEAVGQPLFRAQGAPHVRADLFATNRLQRPRPGQLGCQRFFTEQRRAFCLYVVAGSRQYLPSIVQQVNGILDALEVAP
jgi:hypothetical protein